MTGAAVAAGTAGAAITIASPFLPTWDLYIQNYSIPEVAFLFLICILASLWPDIDVKSKGQRLFYLLFFAADTLLIYSKHFLASAILGYLAMLPLLFPHRSFTHSKSAALIFCLPILLIPMGIQLHLTWSGLPYFLAALLGYLSHLVLDGEFLKK